MTACCQHHVTPKLQVTEGQALHTDFSTPLTPLEYCEPQRLCVAPGSTALIRETLCCSAFPSIYFLFLPLPRFTFLSLSLLCLSACLTAKLFACAVVSVSPPPPTHTVCLTSNAVSQSDDKLIYYCSLALTHPFQMNFHIPRCADIDLCSSLTDKVQLHA